MATFRIGQRVRIVAASRFPHLHGTEATIVDLFPNDPKGLIYAISADRDDSQFFGAKSHWIEPIQPERNQVIAWAECLWQPEHLRERA